jgi:diguanylate cyclase (GGDEF)-like protein
MTVFDKVNYLLKAASLLVEKHHVTLLWADAELRIRYHQPQDISWLIDLDHNPVGLRITDIFVELFGLEHTLLDLVHGSLDHFDIELVERDAPDGEKNFYSYSFYPCALDSSEPGLLMICEQSRVSDLIERLTQSYSELRLLHAELSRSTTTDVLTQVGNRFALVKAISDRSAEIQQQGDDLVIVAIDVDDLKKTNNQYGRQQGDLLLQSFSKALLSGFGTQASVFRMSGDEFVVFIPSHAPADFANLTREYARVEEQVQSEGFPHAKASAGFAALSERGYNFWDTLQLADRRMYQEKRLHHKG